MVVLQRDNQKKITGIAERKYKTIIIYDLHDENKERRNEKMINTIIKIDNTDKKKRQMKDQKRNEMSVSEQRQW